MEGDGVAGRSERSRHSRDTHAGENDSAWPAGITCVPESTQPVFINAPGRTDIKHDKAVRVGGPNSTSEEGKSRVMGSANETLLRSTLTL